MTNSTDRLQAKPIEEQKKEKKFLFQFVSHTDGKRSKPFVGSWTVINEILDHKEDGEAPHDQDFILLVAVLDGKDTVIPGTPLITVKTFKEFENGPKNQDMASENEEHS